MAKPPSRVVTIESNLDSLIDTETDGKEDVIAYRKLLAEVRSKGDSMNVAKSLDK
jgi:hypothetical protein